MKVIVFTTSLSGGGAERHTARLAGALAQLDVDVRIVIARPRFTFVGDMNGSVSIDAPPESSDGRGSTASLIHAVARLRRRIRAEQPDIVLAVMDICGLVAHVACAGLAQRPRIVVSVQNPPVLQYRGLAGRIMPRVFAQSYMRAHRIIAISRGIASEIAQLSPAAADRIVMIHNAGTNGGGPPSWTPAAHPEGHLLAVGRLTRQKGFDILLRALAMLHERGHRRHLVIIGEGEDRGALESLAHELGLADFVSMPGFGTRPFQTAHAAALFVLSSRWEGFGNVIVEAMAAGMPVVATDAPWGPGEIVEHGVNGVLCEPESAVALAAALEVLLGDREYSERIAAAGHASAQQFSPAMIARQHLDLAFQP